MKNAGSTPSNDSGLMARIIDPAHPHFPECGTFTGKVIRLFGVPMAELRIPNCCHGTDGAFVERGQISIDLPDALTRLNRLEREDSR